MRVNNNLYAVNDDVILRYSRTLQAINAPKSERFDAVLAEARSRSTLNTGRDTLIASSAQKYFNAGTSGTDTLIIAKAQEILQSRSWTNFGRYDPVLASRRRNGETSCA